MEILRRLLFCAPLLFIGVLLAADPASFVRSARAFAEVLRTFEQRARGAVWAEPMEWAEVSKRALKAMRVVGAGLIVFALAVLAGAAG